MPRLGLGLGLGRASGGDSLAGGTLAAVSGPGTFEAVGGTWTIGDTSPVLWCRAGEGLTVGAEATMPAVAAWSLLTTTRGTSGAWTTIINDAAVGALHYAKTQLTGSLAAPAVYILDLCRGTPPPGEAVNKVRIRATHAGSDLQVDVNLDAGTLSGSEFFSATIVALGANSDAGYRVTINNTAHAVSEEIILSLLVGDSAVYDDASGTGVFKIREENTATQARAVAWADCRGGAYTDACVQATDAQQPVIVTDAYGAGLDFNAAQEMTCHELAALGGAGTHPACTVAIAFDKAANTSHNFWAFRNSSTTRAWRLGNETGTWYPERYNDGGTAVVRATSAATFPFLGSHVTRFSGTALLNRINGVDAGTGNGSPDLTADQLWLGSVAGTRRAIMRVRQFAIWDRYLSDAEAAAVDIVMRLNAGYP